MKPERIGAKKIRWNPYGKHLKAVVESARNDDHQTEYQVSSVLSETAENIMRTIQSHGHIDDTLGRIISNIAENPYSPTAEIIHQSILPYVVNYANKVLIAANCATGKETGIYNARFVQYVKTAGSSEKYVPTSEFDRISRMLDARSDDDLGVFSRGVPTEYIIATIGGDFPIIAMDIASEISKKIAPGIMDTKDDSEYVQMFKSKMDGAAEAISTDISELTDPQGTLKDRINMYIGLILTGKGKLRDILRKYAAGIVDATKAHNGEHTSDKYVTEFNRYIKKSGISVDGSTLPGPMFEKFILIRDESTLSALKSEGIDSTESDVIFNKICMPICNGFREIAAYLRTMMSKSSVLSTDLGNHQEKKHHKVSKLSMIYEEIAGHMAHPDQYALIPGNIDDSENATKGMTEKQHTLFIVAGDILKESAKINASIGSVTTAIDTIYKIAPIVHLDVRLLPTAYRLSINTIELENEFNAIPGLISQDIPMSTEHQESIKHALERIANACDAHMHLVIMLVYGPGANKERAAIAYFETDMHNLSRQADHIISEYNASHNKSVITFIQDIGTSKTSAEARASIRKTAMRKMTNKYRQNQSEDQILLAGAPVSEYPEILNSVEGILSDIASDVSNRSAEQELHKIISDIKSGSPKIRTLADLTNRISGVCGILGNGDAPEYREEISALKNIEQALEDTVDARESSPGGLLDVVPGIEEYPIRYDDF